MRKALRNWWEGEFIPHRNEPNSGFFILGGITKRHWTATALRWAVDFYGREWKWVLGSVAVVGAYVLKN